jgi:hypothetical protein
LSTKSDFRTSYRAAYFGVKFSPQPQATEGVMMTVTESKDLKKGARVYWRGEAADSGIITETSWDAVTIAWNNGQVATVHHGDMREIHSKPAHPKGA